MGDHEIEPKVFEPVVIEPEDAEEKEEKPNVETFGALEKCANCDRKPNYILYVWPTQDECNTYYLCNGHFTITSARYRANPDFCTYPCGRLGWKHI